MKIESFFEIKYLQNLFEDKFINSRTKGIDKINSFVFAKNKIDSFNLIQKKVLANSYKFSPYLEILKLKGRNKSPRVISIPTIRDRIVLLSVKEILHNYFPECINRKLPNSYIRDIKGYLQIGNQKFYYLKLDIEKFYDNINRDKLISILKNRKIDQRIIDLINNAISNPTVPINIRKDKQSDFVNSKGIPQGLSISNILAQIYLINLDKVIDKRKYFYRRYVDDIIIINSSPITPFRKKNIVAELKKIDLSINENKTEKGMLSSYFIFLSYKISKQNISISDKNVESLIKRIAGKFTWFKNGISNKDKRPSWLIDDNRYKEVFIEELNETITGIISTKKNYGWMFYFSEMNDLSLLFKIDKIINSFFNDLVFFKNSKPKNLKSLVRTYYEIRHKKKSNYVSNYDIIDTFRKKRDFLIFRGKVNPAINYDVTEINTIFEKYRIKQITNVEKDIGYKYG